MDALKKLKEQTSNLNKKPDVESDNTQDLLVESSLIEGSQFYMFGVYECYCFLKGVNSLLPEEVMKKLKSLPSIEKNKREEFLRSSDDDFNNFLAWYFYEYKK